jgi:hypothetical protein
LYFPRFIAPFSIILRFVRFQQSDQFIKLPNVVGQSSLHRWRHAECLVNPAVVVVHLVNRDCVRVILDLF